MPSLSLSTCIHTGGIDSSDESIPFWNQFLLRNQFQGIDYPLLRWAVAGVAPDLPALLPRGEAQEDRPPASTQREAHLRRSGLGHSIIK